MLFLTKKTMNPTKPMKAEDCLPARSRYFLFLLKQSRFFGCKLSHPRSSGNDYDLNEIRDAFHTDFFYDNCI